MPDSDSLNWYGSGDVNNDNMIDWHDLYRFDSLLNGLFSDPLASRYFDRSDLNGDQFISMEDRVLLTDYLEGTITCLPAHWNCLGTKEERIDWLEKILLIDRTDQESNPPDYPGDYYADQLFINVHGLEDALLSMFPSPPVESQHNGRFNLPVTFASVLYDRPELSLNRSLLAIMVGDNVFDWSDWCYIDPQWDQLLFTDGAGEPTGNESFPLLNSWVDDINNITQRDTTAPSIELGIDDDTVLLKSGHVDLDYAFSEKNLKEAVYYIDDPEEEAFLFKDSMVLDVANERLIPVYNNSGTINLKLRNGQYFFRFQARDHFFNEVSREFLLAIDDPSPEISILSPIEDSSYTEYLPLFHYSIEEPDLDKAWYTLDSGETIIEIQQEGDFFLYLENGDYQMVVFAEDLFGNQGRDTVKFSVDLKAPVIDPGTVEDSAIFVYPNPVTDVLNVLVPSKETVVHVDLQDSSGRVLWEFSPDNPSAFRNRFTVNLTGHPKGIYFLKCYYNSGERIMTKIVKL